MNTESAMTWSAGGGGGGGGDNALRSGKEMTPIFGNQVYGAQWDIPEKNKLTIKG